MRYSRMGIKTYHSRPSDEFYAQSLMFQSSQLRRHAAGVFGYGNFLVRARNKIVNVVRDSLYRYGCSEVSLPVLQPKNLWEQSGRWKVFSEVDLLFSFVGRNSEYCLAPTGEEIVLDFAKTNIQSYKDMPVNIFQIGSKFRDELRVRGGILRSKEFLMKDGYSFHATLEDLEREYENMRSCYIDIFSQLGLEVFIVEALNSDMGGKVSHEFMCESEIGEDCVLISPDCNCYLNAEVLEDAAALKLLKERYCALNIENFQKKKALELGHIFQLGTFYSSKMGGEFMDEFGNKKPYYMGCYGIGINRVLGAICEKYCDGGGFLWPKNIAPYLCAIIYNETNIDEANRLYNFLLDENIEVVLFDNEATFGSKIKDAKLLGFPYLIIMGNKYKDDALLEVEKRIDSTKLYMTPSSLVEFCKKSV